MVWKICFCQKKEEKNSIQKEKLKKEEAACARGGALCITRPLGGVISSDPPLAPPPPKQHHRRRVFISETCVCDYVVFSLVLRDKCVQKNIYSKKNTYKGETDFNMSEVLKCINDKKNSKHSTADNSWVEVWNHGERFSFVRVLGAQCLVSGSMLLHCFVQTTKKRQHL